MEAKLYGQKAGGMNINGIIEDYYVYAGENISAGDLVEFINGVASKVDYGTSTDTMLSNIVNSAQSEIEAVALDSKRVVVFFNNYNNNDTLWCVVATIEGSNITCGASHQLHTTPYTGNYFSGVLLKNGKVFLAFSHTSDTTLQAMILTIEGTVVSSIDTVVELSATSKSGLHVTTTLLENGDVFVSHCSGSSIYFYGMVCTINGTTITKGTDTTIHAAYAGVWAASTLLDSGDVFIAYCSDSSKYYLYGAVCKISGTTITASYKQLSTITRSCYYATTSLSLPNNKVFIVHNYGTDNHMYGMLVTVDDINITVNLDGQLCGNYTSITSGHQRTAVLYEDNKVLVLYGDNQETYLVGKTVEIRETGLSVISTIKLSTVANTTTSIKALILPNGTIFVPHSYGSSYQLYAQIFDITQNDIPTNDIEATDYETQVRKVTTPTFDGVAKTSGTGGTSTAHKDKVSIYTLVEAQEFAMADGNTLHDANGNLFTVKAAS